MGDGYVRVAAATPKLRVADTEYNRKEMLSLMQEAAGEGVKLLVFPELSITGYTVQDLFLSSQLIKSAEDGLHRYCEGTKGSDVLSFVGFPLSYKGKLYNSAVAIQDGKILSFTLKSHIPAYGEFQEERWFSPSFSGYVYEKGVPIGNRIIHRFGDIGIAAEICEDLWVATSPSSFHVQNGATIIANLSASDEVVGKDQYRMELIRSTSGKGLSGYVYASASDGESSTDLVFSSKMAIAENGAVLNESNFHKGLLISEIDNGRLISERRKMTTFSLREDDYAFVDISFEEQWTSLTRKFSPYPFVPEEKENLTSRSSLILDLQAMGLKKRIEHTGAKKLVLGLSGGLDSTLALLVSVRALDMLKRPRTDILAITMPCFGTTGRTLRNARDLALALGVSFEEIDIKKSVLSHFEDIGQKEDDYSVTYENAQARERTQVLMDKANMYSGLVIGTGDLSELALGWATYNGDHMSMYGVNSSIPKTLVRHLVNYVRMENGPESKTLEDILDTPVSPELLPAKDGKISQVTEDIVGPYELHDFFLYYFVRLGFTPRKIFRLAKLAFTGIYDEDIILKWEKTFLRRFFAQQFKRSALPDGPKVGSVTFSPRSDWRMPSDAVISSFLDGFDTCGGER